MCVVDMEGKQSPAGVNAPAKSCLHLAIYKERDDVKAVIHSHPPHATAFAIADMELPTCIHPEAEVFLGPVRMAKYVTPGDKRLGESIQPFIKDSNTILLGNHGVVCYGRSGRCLLQAGNCRCLRPAPAAGQATWQGSDPLETEEMRELMALKGNSAWPIRERRAVIPRVTLAISCRGSAVRWAARPDVHAGRRRLCGSRRRHWSVPWPIVPGEVLRSRFGAVGASDHRPDHGSGFTAEAMRRNRST